MTTQIVPFGASPVVRDDAKGIGLMGVTVFIAAQFGKTLDDIKAHRDTMPLVKDKKTGEDKKPSLMASCKSLLLKEKLATEDQIKALGKSYDQNRNQVYQGMRAHNAVLASSPDVRVTMKATKNKAGVVTRWHTTYAPAGEGQSKKQQIADLQSQVKRLTALLQKKTLVATTEVVADETPIL